MNWDAISAIGEIVGAIAVVVTLLYLAVQMRHSAAATQGARRDTIAQLTTDILVRIASDAELASIFRRGQNDPESLDDDEAFRFDVLLYTIFDHWETMHSQIQRSTFAEEDWAKYETIIGFYMAQPGAQRFWESFAGSFTKTFQAYVENVAQKKHGVWRENGSKKL